MTVDEQLAIFLFGVGWEVLAADMRVLRWACDKGGFTIPDGKFYLVDSGYANTDKFLAHYRDERQQRNDMYFNEEIDQLSIGNDDEEPPNIGGADESRRGYSLHRTITEQLWNSRC
ncbi:hypothetical protein ACMD2_18995 [Ananas comosus]|uniref:DDE Tnp4 domain-containing protein n=1 Tax=Ananas comosus TaxID=4615 RepID=A0A199VWT7_ANACO|nr:hypothetical protein ACMD2_18995 [Ananas comosus]